jgi:hypothetical protein
MKLIATLLLSILCLSLNAQTCITNSNSLNFTGNSYVSFASDNNLQLDSTITIEAWIRASSWGVSNFSGSIVCKHSWSLNGEQGFVLRAGGSGQLNFTIAGLDPSSNPTSWINVTSPTGAMALNTWYHVAGSYDGDTLRAFINGIQVAATPFTGSIVPPTAYPITIGRLSDQAQTPSRYWFGNIDEVRIWNRALSKSEILANKNSHLDTSVMQTGLVGYYRFNEGTGTNINDLSGSGNNGSISSAVFSSLVPFNQTAATPIIFANANTLTSTIAASYQWNFNGNAIVGANSQSYAATQNGNYTVTITDSIGCNATSTAYIVTGVGLVSIANELGITINQLQGEIIVSSQKANLNKTISLLNLNGKVINSFKDDSEIIKISTAKLSQGVYILNISSGNRNLNKKIFIY